MKSKVPEVTAYRLEEATNILAKSGIKFYLKKTSPPSLLRRTEIKAVARIQGEVTGYRVLKQTLLADNTLELVVAKEITYM